MAKTIYEVLSEEHDEAKEMLERLASTSEDDAKTRRELGARLVLELISHNEAESKTLYQRLMDFEAISDHVETHEDEHEEANEKLRTLLDMDVGDADWLDMLTEIKAAIEQHIEDEEEKLFAEAKKHLDEAEAEDLAESFKEEKSRRKGLLKAA